MQLQAFESYRADSGRGPSQAASQQQMSNLQNLAHNSAYALEMDGRLGESVDAPLRKRDRWKSRPTFLIARCAAPCLCVGSTTIPQG